MKFGEPSIYKVTFFGNTTTFKNAINEDELSNLVWLNEFNHSATATNVKDGLENGLNFTVDSVAYNNAIIYPLVAHSQSYVYDNTNNDSNGLNISYTNNQNRTQRGVVTEDLKPAILVKNIIKAIEEQYNITFKTGEFLVSGTSCGKLELIFSSKPVFFPKIPLNLRKINPAIIASSIISIYSKL